MEGDSKEAKESHEPSPQVGLNIGKLVYSSTNGRTIRIALNKGSILVKGNKNHLFVKVNLGTIKIIGNDNLINITQGKPPELEGLRNKLSKFDPEKVSQIQKVPPHMSRNPDIGRPNTDSDDEAEEQEGRNNTHIRFVVTTTRIPIPTSVEQWPQEQTYQVPQPGTATSSGLLARVYPIDTTPDFPSLSPILDQEDIMIKEGTAIRLQNGKLAAIIKIPMTGRRTTSECCICNSDPKNLKSVTTLNCNHEFCTKCVIPWVRNKGTCPLCRGEIKEMIQYTIPVRPPAEQPAEPIPDKHTEADFAEEDSSGTEGGEHAEVD